MSSHKKTVAIFEIIFDILYLTTGFIMGIIMLSCGTADIKRIYGLMTLVLIFGDMFHLTARIKASLSENKAKFTRRLGLGKMITSVTMTIFYIILWHIGLIYFKIDGLHAVTLVIYILSIIRIALCIAPQNKWTQNKPSQRWNIYRNIPFIILGAIVFLFFWTKAYYASPFSLMWLAILLSFAFYIPVVLWAGKHPVIGMLMLPKSCVYIWIIAMGLFIT